MANSDFWGNVNFHDNQVKRMVLENTIYSSYFSPVEGAFIYDIGNKVPYFYDGTSWKTMGLSINNPGDNRVVLSGSTSSDPLEAQENLVYTDEILFAKQDNFKGGFTSFGITTNKNNMLGEIGFSGVYRNSTDGISSGLKSFCTENWSGTSNGSELSLFSTENGTTNALPHVRIGNTGEVIIGKNLNISNTIMTENSLHIYGSFGANVIRVHRSYTADTNLNKDYTILADSGSVITIPDPSSFGQGRILNIKHYKDSGTGVVTIKTVSGGADFYDDDSYTSLHLDNVGDSVTLAAYWSSGVSKWYVISKSYSPSKSSYLRFTAYNATNMGTATIGNTWASVGVQALNPDYNDGFTMITSGSNQGIQVDNIDKVSRIEIYIQLTFNITNVATSSENIYLTYGINGIPSGRPDNFKTKIMITDRAKIDLYVPISARFFDEVSKNDVINFYLRTDTTGVTGQIESCSIGFKVYK